MPVIGFSREARTLEEKAEHLVTSRLLKADTFGVTLLVYDREAESRLHECGRDEFFYVLRGEVEVQAENESNLLREGEGILVKAGQKHRHRPLDRAWVLIITKHPHSHRFYETA